MGLQRLAVAIDALNISWSEQMKPTVSVDSLGDFMFPSLESAVILGNYFNYENYTDTLKSHFKTNSLFFCLHLIYSI